MPELIYETVVTTRDAAGRVHIAPMGVRYLGDEVVLMPFRPSQTLANIEAGGCAVLNLLTEVRVFAGCVTGRRDWPTLPLDDGSPGVPPFPGVRLAAALGHAALRLVHHDQGAERPVLRLARVHEATHAPFAGLNRAQAAVIEGAVLVSRLHLLPADKVERELAYLQIAIDKTAGPAELEAWGWLLQAVAAHAARSAAGPAAGPAEPPASGVSWGRPGR
ncbi:DUF447 domain-containing protein [Piscinibacter sakaiensis]|uniref:DUF447 family protein n=1 Tax=Piscinibacter sakaiensis TaxID=1547922 RepID=A0A0K8P4W7_PISS1|nr:DUF447 domain-containing protein [Piscinibacter sakaiensis]GAP37718.1 DUF447 family protein [Piscinibacter sakaiensis]